MPFRSAVLALLVLAAARTDAQQALPVPPEPPQVAPAALVPATIDAGFAAWSDARMPSEAARTPILLQTGRFEVLVMAPSARRFVHAENAMRPAVNRCAEAASLGETGRAAVAALDPWAGFERAAAAVPLVAFSIVPSHGMATICGAPVEEGWAPVGRGIRFGRKPRYEPTNDARTAQLLVDGAAVEPALAGRAPVTEVARGEQGRDGTMQVRLYVSPDAFAPDARGAMPNVELVVWTAQGDGMPERIRIDTAVTRRLWDDALVWRARRQGLADAERALDDLTATETDWPARRSALYRAISSFSQAGDEAAARGFAAALMRREPCLTVSPDADARTRALLDRLRPRARCSADATAKVALRAIVPGMAQAVGQRRYVVAAVAIGVVGATLSSGASRHADARDRYDRYLARTGFETDRVTVEQLFDGAESMRTQGNMLIAFGIAAWAIAGFEAIYFESRHRAHLDRVRDFDRRAAPRLSLIPAPTGRGVGIAVEVFR